MLVLFLSCSSSTADTADAADAAVTWHRDIQPIVERSCAGCHSDGGIAPFTLTTFQEVSAASASVNAAVADRRMPPWGANSAVQSYLNDPSLTDDEIALIADWVEGGMPEGSPDDASEADPISRPVLPRVDLSLTQAAPHTPDFSDSPDAYRCFLLEWPEEQTRYITGYQVDPGNADLAHHVILFLATPETLGEYTALDEADPGEGYDCFGGPGGSSRAAWLGGWVPGGGATLFPEDTGIAVEPGSAVILQVHYNDSGVAEAEAQTAIDLVIESAVERPALIQPLTDLSWVTGGEMVIPAGSEGVRYSTTIPIGADLRLYSGGMHMHTLATSGQLWVDRQDGEQEWLVDIPQWDFSWQQSYWLEEPIDFSAGDSISLACEWDNPGAEDVAWGDGTADEMCLGIVYLTER